MLDIHIYYEYNYPILFERTVNTMTNYNFISEKIQIFIQSMSMEFACKALSCADLSAFIS